VAKAVMFLWLSHLPEEGQDIECCARLELEHVGHSILNKCKLFKLWYAGL
jgi:hypothetical protein